MAMLLAKVLASLVMCQCATFALGFLPGFGGWDSKNKFYGILQNSSETMGGTCGRRKCLTGLEGCAGKRCQCPPGRPGDGMLGCAPEDSVVCSVTADPHVQGFGDSSVSVDLPCRYPVAEVKVPFGGGLVNDTHEKSCTLIVHATNILYNNKFYVTMVDITARIQDNLQKDKEFYVEVEAMFEGKGSNGQYHYRKRGTVEEGYMGDITRLDNPMYVNFTESMTVYDEDNNLVGFPIDECGMGVTFRHADFGVLGMQTQLPGLTVHIPGNAIFRGDHSSFQKRHEGQYPCGTTQAPASLWADRAAKLGLDDAKLAVLHDILVLERPDQAACCWGLPGSDDHPNSQMCGATMSYLGDMDEADAAKVLNICGPILTNKATRACFNTYVDVMKGFLWCAYVANNITIDSECDTLAQVVQDCGLAWPGGFPACDSLDDLF